MSKRHKGRAATLAGDPRGTELREVNAYVANLDLLARQLQEATLEVERELSLDDAGWERIGVSQRELSRPDLTTIIARSRRMYLRDPLINRAVNVQSYYVWGQGVNVQATDADVNAAVQAFLDDSGNRAVFTGHQARSLKEVSLQVTGNIFFCFFVDPTTGAVQVRTIPIDEIEAILCNPDDSVDTWYYRRTWSQQNLDGSLTMRTAYYPDWQHWQGADRPPEPPGATVIWDVPIYHVKVGALDDMRFGLPETYQALDWAKAYKSFLEDRATVARALAKFVFRVAVPGGKAGIAAAKAKLGTTLGLTSHETNPPPPAGAAFVAGQNGATLDPIRTSGATINPDEGRRFLLMVAAAMGLPETFFGDSSVGSLATAKSLDRPTELKFSERRALWADVWSAILQFTIEQKVRAGQLPESADRHVDVGFPDLLESDVTARVSSIVSAATLDGKAPAGTIDDRTLVRLLLTALGVDQVDELVDAIAPAKGESLMAQLRSQKAAQAMAIADKQAQSTAAKAGQQGPPPAKGDPTAPPDQTATEALMVRAVEELREAVARVIGD